MLRGSENWPVGSTITYRDASGARHTGVVRRHRGPYSLEVQEGRSMFIVPCSLVITEKENASE